MTIKTFRGQIADGGQDIIVLHTKDGSTGYRIVKLQVIHARPGELGSDSEHTLKVYKIPQTTVTNDVDFSDNTLLAAASMGNSSQAFYYGTTPVIIFDTEVFNQDIYLTHIDTNGTESLNYYIELEQIKLALDENTVATLKDIRNITAPA